MTLASQSPSGMGLHPKPILDDLDASIFRVAHRYRNDVYHAGRHNPALIAPLAQLYAEAVGRAFVKSQEKGHSMGGLAKERLADLDRYDWRGDRRDDRPWETFIPRDAAQRIMTQICVFTPLVPSDLAHELAADIDERCDAVTHDLDELGLPDMAVEGLFRAAQLWAAYRADDELLRLGEEHREMLWAAAQAGETDDGTRAAIDAAKRAVDARSDELIRNSAFPLKIEDMGVIREQARAIPQMQAVTPIVLRYQELDERLDQLELAIGWMVIEWNRYVELQDEIRRGK